MVADRGTREAPVYSPVLGEIVFSVEPVRVCVLDLHARLGRATNALV